MYFCVNDPFSNDPCKARLVWVFALIDIALSSEYTLAREQQHKQLWNTYLRALENWHEY